MLRNIFLSFTLVGSASSSTADSPTEFDPLWADFKIRFNRHYKSDEEEADRRRNFDRNMERAQSLNKKDNNWIPYSHLSPLADWSEFEFQKRNALNAEGIRKGLKESPTPLSSTDEVPTEFDWVNKGAVNDVKDQGQCGSCWSFATTANIEGVNFHENGELISLSEQQLVDCDESDNGCDGGLPEQADKWLIATKNGLESEKDYPYEAKAGECRQVPSRERVFVGEFIHLGQDEDDMARALMQYGPLSIGINAKLMQLYSGGIAQPSEEDCDPEELDHGVTLVAFGTGDAPENPQAMKEKLMRKYRMRATALLAGKEGVVEDETDSFGASGELKGDKVKFWTIRNSWGSMWGEDGYYRIQRGVGACGLNQLATTATKVRKEDMNENQDTKLEEEMYV